MRRALLTASCALVLLAAPAAAQPTMRAEPAGAVSVADAWARPTTSKATSAGAFLTLRNPGGAPDRLVGAAAPEVAERTEIHSHIMDGGVARMRAVEGGVELPASGTVALQPGGRHVMLLGLRRQLKPGESFPMTLAFEKAGAVTVDVRVLAPKDEPKPAAGAHDHGHGHGHGHGAAHDHGGHKH